MAPALETCEAVATLATACEDSEMLAMANEAQKLVQSLLDDYSE